MRVRSTGGALLTPSERIVWCCGASWAPMARSRRIIVTQRCGELPFCFFHARALSLLVPVAVPSLLVYECVGTVCAQSASSSNPAAAMFNVRDTRDCRVEYNSIYTCTPRGCRPARATRKLQNDKLKCEDAGDGSAAPPGRGRGLGGGDPDRVNGACERAPMRGRPPRSSCPHLDGPG